MFISKSNQPEVIMSTKSKQRNGGEKRGNSYDIRRRLATLATRHGHADAPIVEVHVMLRSGSIVKPFARLMPLYGTCANEDCACEIDFGIRQNIGETGGRIIKEVAYGAYIIDGKSRETGGRVAEQDRIGSFDADGNWTAGGYTLDNLQLTCRECNRDKSDKGYFA